MPWQFEDAVRNDAEVAARLKAGQSLEMIVASLAEGKHNLLKQIMDLKGICPMKIHANGKEYTWRCPDDLVPNLDI